MQEPKDTVIKQQKDKKGELLWSLYWFPVAGITNTLTWGKKSEIKMLAGLPP